MPATNTRRRLALMQRECQRRRTYGGRMERGELESLLDPRVLTAVDAEARPGTSADVVARSTSCQAFRVAPVTVTRRTTSAIFRRNIRTSRLLWTFLSATVTVRRADVRFVTSM